MHMRELGGKTYANHDASGPTAPKGRPRFTGPARFCLA